MPRQIANNSGDPEQQAGWNRLWAAVQPALDPHPVDPGTLGEYAFVLQQRGREAAERLFPNVAAHLRSRCERCATDLRELSELPLEVQPAPESTLRRIVATLLGPGPGQHLAPARGVRQSTIRGYAAGELAFSITVFAGQQSDSSSVEGIVTSGDATGATAHLAMRGGGSTYASTIDAAGNFGFDDVVAGAYDLELHLVDNAVVVVEDLRVGARGADTV